MKVANDEGLLQEASNLLAGCGPNVCQARRLGQGEEKRWGVDSGGLQKLELMDVRPLPGCI